MTDNSQSKDNDKQNLFILSRSALLRGLCYLIPVPFLDDFIAQRVLKNMVTSLLNDHGRSFPDKRVAVLYEGESKGCLAKIWSFAVGLIIKPLKKLFKTFFFVLAIRDVALGIGSTLFLGRCLNRSLNQQALGNEDASKAEADPTSLEAQSLQIFQAYKTSYKGSDKKVILQTLQAFLKQLKGLGSWGVSAVKTLFGKKQESYDGVEALPEGEQVKVVKAVHGLTELMQQEEFAKILTNFDTDFDACLAKTREGSAS